MFCREGEKESVNVCVCRENERGGGDFHLGFTHGFMLKFPFGCGIFVIVFTWRYSVLLIEKNTGFPQQKKGVTIGHQLRTNGIYKRRNFPFKLRCE